MHIYPNRYPKHHSLNIHIQLAVCICHIYVHIRTVCIEFIIYIYNEHMGNEQLGEFSKHKNIQQKPCYLGDNCSAKTMKQGSRETKSQQIETEANRRTI